MRGQVLHPDRVEKLRLNPGDNPAFELGSACQKQAFASEEVAKTTAEALHRMCGLKFQVTRCTRRRLFHLEPIG